MTPILYYPEIQVHGTTAGTILRRKYRGVWYQWIFIVNSSTIQQSLKDINRNVYLAILFGKMDIKMVDSFGMPIFKRDPLQFSEQERLNLKSV